MLTNNYYKKYLKYKNKYLTLKGGQITSNPAFEFIESIGFEFETNGIISLLIKPDNTLDYLPLSIISSDIANSFVKYVVRINNIQISDELVLSYDSGHNFLSSFLNFDEVVVPQILFKQHDTKQVLTLNHYTQKESEESKDDFKRALSGIDTEFIVTFPSIKPNINIIINKFNLACKKICDFINDPSKISKRYNLTAPHTDLNINVDSFEYNKLLLLHKTPLNLIQFDIQCTIKVKLQNLYNVLNIILVNAIQQKVMFNTFYIISTNIITKLFERLEIHKDSNLNYFNEIITIMTLIFSRIYFYNIYINTIPRHIYKYHSYFYIRHDFKSLFYEIQLSSLKSHTSETIPFDVIMENLIYIINSFKLICSEISIYNIKLSFDQIIEYINYLNSKDPLHKHEIDEVDNLSTKFNYKDKYIFIEIRDFHTQLLKLHTKKRISFEDLINFSTKAVDDGVSDMTSHESSVTCGGAGYSVCVATTSADSVVIESRLSATDINTYIDDITKILEQPGSRGKLMEINSQLDEKFKQFNIELLLNVINKIDSITLQQSDIDASEKTFLKREKVGNSVNKFNGAFISSSIFKLFKIKLVSYAIYFNITNEPDIIAKLQTDQIETFLNIN